MKFLKNRKKYLIALLSAVCVCSFIGCKDDVTEDSSQSTGADSSSEIVEESSSAVVLTLNKSSLVLLPGDESILKTGIETIGLDLTWESSNPTVATVDENGKVTAYSEGEAEITVSYMGASATCTVSVNAGALLPVLVMEGVVEDNVTVTLTDTLNVSAQALFNGKIFDDVALTYELSDETVGTVENGEFKPAKVGSTEITIVGTWRGFTGVTLTKTLAVNVINSTTVVINGGQTSALYLYTASSHGGVEYATSSPFDVLVQENGQDVQPNVSITKGENVVSYDATEKKVSAITYGEAEITITFTDANQQVNTLVVPIIVARPVAVYQDTVEYFSAMDGDLPVSDIFGADTELVDAYQGETTLTIDDNKVLGVATERTGVTKTQLTVYDKDVGYLLNVDAYTKVIDEESDFSVFGTKRENVDGYFVLKNDIVCVSEWNGACDFAGTFDGQGFAIKNLTIPHMPSAEQLPDGKWDARRGGMFGSILGGATVKNVAFTDVNLKGYDSSVIAASSQASYYINSTIENVYIAIKSLNTSGRPGVLFWDRGVWDVVRNVIIDASAFNGVTSFGNTYGPMFGSDKWPAYDNGSSWADDNKRISNVYVIAEEGTPMTKNTGYGANLATIYASNEGVEEDKEQKQYVYTGVKRCDSFSALAQMVNVVGDDENYWTISELGIEWKGELPEVETITYEHTIKNFSALDGELPIEEIFGTTDVVITEAYQNGTKLKVDNNKVLGVATRNDQMTETQILIFSAKANYLLNVEAYTKVIDEESDLSAFDTSNGIVNGYFVLANDVVCTGEKEWTNQYNTSEASGPLKYFAGVLDGQGHKIIGLKVGENGLLGAMGSSAVVKNIAFTETILAGGSWKNTALLGHMSLASANSGSAIENVYIHIADFREVSAGDRASGLLYVYNKDIKINNLVMVIDSTNMDSNPLYGYGALFEHDRVKGSATNITNVYLVSVLTPLAMHCQIVDGTPLESCVIYAGNDRETAGKLEKDQTLYYDGVQRYDDLTGLANAVTKVGNWSISASAITWVEDAE